MPAAQPKLSIASKLVWSYAAMFLLSLAILAGLGWWFTVTSLNNGLKTHIESGARFAMLQTTAEGLRDALDGGGFVYRYEDGNTLPVGVLRGVDVTALKSGEWLDISRSEDIGGEEDPDQLHGLFVVDGNRSLLIASDTETLENAKYTFLSLLGLSAVLAPLLAFLGGQWLSRQFARRFDVLSATAGTIVGGDWSARMPVGSEPDAFNDLARRLNVMLDHNAATLQREKQITTDIAHDLRTPLTRLRQHIESGRKGKAFMELDGVIATSNALLRIAEIEGSARKAGFERVDLADIVAHVVEAYRPDFESQKRNIEFVHGNEVMVLADTQLLRQAVANLLDNVLTHTQVGTAVAIDVKRVRQEALLSVRDEGPGVPSPELQKLTRRLYKTDRSTRGYGLGLSMVEAIAALHDAGFDVSNTEPGLRVTLRFAIASDEA